MPFSPSWNSLYQAPQYAGNPFTSQGTILGAQTGLGAGTNLSQYTQNLLSGNYMGTGYAGSPVVPVGGTPVASLATRISSMAPYMTAPTVQSGATGGYRGLPYQYTAGQQAATQQPAAPSYFNPVSQRFGQSGYSPAISSALSGVNLHDPGIQQALGQSSYYLSGIQSGLQSPGSAAYGRSQQALANLPNYLNQLVQEQQQAKQTAAQTAYYSQNPQMAEQAGLIGGNLAATYEMMKGAYVPGASTAENQARANVAKQQLALGTAAGVPAKMWQQFLNESDMTQMTPDQIAKDMQQPSFQREWQDYVKRHGG